MSKKRYRMAVFFVYEIEGLNSNDATLIILNNLASGFDAERVRDLSISTKSVLPIPVSVETPAPVAQKEVD